VNVSVKYFSKLCFGTIEIQPELKNLKIILEVFTFLFQRAKALEHEFGRVPSISSIFTGSKMARICKGIKYKYFVKLFQLSEHPSFSSGWCVCIRSGFLGFDIKVTQQHAFYQAKPIILEKTVFQKSMTTLFFSRM